MTSPDPLVSFPVGLHEGDIVAGRYRLERVIGRGGMGVVVLAYHLELEEQVAVKFLSSDSLSDPEAVSRFDREIRAAARLKNEHVARVYDAGKLPDGGRFMVLEYLEGEDLAARVRRLGPLEPAVAVRYLLQACAAVLEAHSLGIIHRDIKPGNLFAIRRPDGAETVKVLDFGVMKRILGSPLGTEAQQTEPGTIVGTPFYTSPEQLRGSHSVDARSDIWSLGATLFELLSGVPPFSGKTYPQVIANVLESAPPSLVTLCPELPDGFDLVVRKCLEKDPSCRYESVAEFAVALSETVSFDPEQQGLLERIVRHRLVSSPLGSPAALLTPVGISNENLALLAPGSRSRNAKRESRRRLLVILSTAGVSAAAVFLLGLSLLPPTRPPLSPNVPESLPTAEVSPLAYGRPLHGNAPALATAGPEAGAQKEESQAPSAALTQSPPQPQAPAQGMQPASRSDRRNFGKSSSTRPTPSAVTTPPPTPIPSPLGVKKNPLLVQPR